MTGIDLVLRQCLPEDSGSYRSTNTSAIQPCALIIGKSTKYYSSRLFGCLFTYVRMYSLAKDGFLRFIKLKVTHLYQKWFYNE